MNLSEILQVLQVIAQILEAAKGLGVDFSNVKVHTSDSVDLSKLVK